MKKLLILFLFLLVLPLTMGAKPEFLSGDFLEGFTLEIPFFESIKVNTSYDFHAHVYNSSNGLPIVSGINCSLHLYNESGTHVVRAPSTFEAPYDYEFMVEGANFSYPGIYSTIITCNSSTQGGFLEKEVHVTYSGYQTDEAQATQTSLTVIAFILVSFLIIFIFIKVGNVIPVESWGTLILKIMFYCFGLAMLFIPVAFLNPMIELARQTIPNNYLAGSLGNNAIGLYNTLFSSLKIALLALAAFGLVYLIYLIYQALLSNAQKNCKGFNGGGQE